MTDEQYCPSRLGFTTEGYKSHSWATKGTVERNSLHYTLLWVDSVTWGTVTAVKEDRPIPHSREQIVVVCTTIIAAIHVHRLTSVDSKHIVFNQSIGAFRKILLKDDFFISMSHCDNHELQCRQWCCQSWLPIQFHHGVATKILLLLLSYFVRSWEAIP